MSDGTFGLSRRKCPLSNCSMITCRIAPPDELSWQPPADDVVAWMGMVASEAVDTTGIKRRRRRRHPTDGPGRSICSSLIAAGKLADAVEGSCACAIRRLSLPVIDGRHGMPPHPEARNKGGRSAPPTDPGSASAGLPGFVDSLGAMSCRIRRHDDL